MFKPAVNIIYRNFDILQSDSEIGSLFPETPILAYRRDQTIRTALVRSLLPTEEETSSKHVGTFTCNRNRRKTCSHVSIRTILEGPQGSYHINKHFTCTSKGIVYAVHCSKWGDIYTGETERCLADHFREHLFFVKKQIFKRVWYLSTLFCLSIVIQIWTC